MSTETQAELRQRIATALLRASFSDWDVGEGHTIELPLEVAADAVMSVLAGDGGEAVSDSGEVIEHPGDTVKCPRCGRRIPRRLVDAHIGDQP